MNLIQQSIRDGSLVLYHDYRLGHAQDLSNNNNHGVFDRTVLQRGGVRFLNAGSEILVADSPELRLTAGSIVALSVTGFSRQRPNGAFIHKRVGVSSNYYFFYNTTSTTLALYDGTNSRTIVKSIQGYKTVACSFTNGATPVGYLDGLSIGNFSGAVNVIPNNHPVEMGNYGASINSASTFSAIMLFNRVLTAAEHALVYEELMK